MCTIPGILQDHFCFLHLLLLLLMPLVFWLFVCHFVFPLLSSSLFSSGIMEIFLP